ncbi:MAG: hypothetical protein K0S23_3408 [Fluviicola sp.]|jgi:hypothetical protein|nr:hypothetical protein [Fluviicola sp.]
MLLGKVTFGWVVTIKDVEFHKEIHLVRIRVLTNRKNILYLKKTRILVLTNQKK